MPSTPIMTNTVVATKTAGPKSLPMKPKTMQCGIVGFLKKMELEGVIESKICETLLIKLPLFGTVEEQVSYYDTNYDIKHIEQTYIKPRVQEHKKANKPQKEKKPRLKKVKEESETTTKPDVIIIPEEEIVAPKTPERVTEIKEPEKPTKKPRVKKSDGEKKPRGRKVKETEVEFARDEDEEMSVARDLTADLEAEAYVKTATPKMEKKPEVNAKEEKPKKKRVAPKKKVAEKAVEKPKEEVEYWLIMRDNVRYWTTDENEKNGDVYQYDGKDEDGDPSPKKKVGKLVDGELQLD